MVAPASLTVLAEKLAPGSSPEVLVVALLHARAHGPAAGELAPSVAALIDHPAPEVQWHAMRAFLAVGAGSAASAPVLTERLERGEPPVLVTRALAGLRHVGPAARGALGAVLARARDGAPRARAEALEALASIAPDEPATTELLLDALYSADFDLRLPALRVLDTAGGALVDRVLDDAERRAEGASPERRVALASAVSACAALRPDRAEPLLAALLAPPEQDCVWPALHGLQKIPAALRPSTVASVVRVVRLGAPAAAPALVVLEKLGPEAPGARDAVLGLLRALANTRAVGGPAGNHARALVAAARAGAKLYPREPEVLDLLVAWLDAAPSTKWAAGEKIGWYELRDALTTATELGPERASVRDAMVRLAKFAAKAPKGDQYAAENVRRVIRAAANAMGDPPALWSALSAAKLPRRAPASDVDEDPPPPALPDFPREGPAEAKKRTRAPAPAPAPVAKALPAALARELRASMARGARLAKVKPADPPAEVAAAVDAAVTRARANKRPMSLDGATALGALWGDALARAAGWSWAQVSLGRHKSVCLVSPDRAHACAPLEYLAAQRAPGAEVTALLLFNMVVAGQLPPSKPGALVRFG